MNPRFIEEMGWRMGQVYAAVTDRILINLARHFKYISEGSTPCGAWDYQIRKLAEMGQVTRETEAIILESLKGADAALAGLLEETIQESLKPVEKPLRKAAEKGLLLGQGFLPPEVSPQMTQTFKAFYNQASEKLNLVNTVMLESTQEAYRATVADIAFRMEQTQGILNIAAGEVVTGVSSLNKAVRDGVQKMVDNGITGYIDHGGHHWSPEAYVTMDIRTTLANTGREAVTEEMQRFGCDTFSVSWHDGARPLCYPWQGKVISENNWTGEVEDLDGNKVHVYALNETSYGEAAGLFGVNCGHYKIPFIPGFSKARQPQQNEEQNAKEYEESQKQRALERKLREEKRDLEVLKAQGASEEEIKEQKWRVKKARDNLNEFCDDTGRARRSSRERTPINAKFPDETTSTKTRTLSDISDYYKENARPGTGSVIPDNGFDSNARNVEKNMADLIHSTYGGDIKMLAEKNPAGVKNPDYLWNGKLWELKTPEGIKGIDDLVHKALKQIASNPGGIIIDTRGFKASTNEIFQSLLYRLKRSSNNSIDIIIFMKGQDPTVYRYKKR